MRLRVRAARPSDCTALAELDLTYATDRTLAGVNSPTSSPVWVSHERAGTATYAHYTEDWLQTVLARVELFLVAEVEGRSAGLLIIPRPSGWSAAEITDLAVGAPHRRQGCGRALIVAAAEWARQRGVRLLWVEPRADNAGAIQFYLSLGFRICAVDADAEGEEGARVAYVCLALG